MKNYFLVLLIATLPLIEIRGAIPYATTWGLPIFWSFVVAIIGNILPVPLIFYFAHKVLIAGQNSRRFGKFCIFCLNKGEKAGEKLLAKAGNGVYWALFAFVAIPLPGTGAWTGTLAASFLELDFKKSVLAATLGVFVAGIIMYIITSGVLHLFAVR